MTLKQRWYYLNSRYYDPLASRFVTMDQVEYLGASGIIDLLRKNPKIILAEVAEKIEKSLRTVKTIIKKLQENGVIKRVGNRKNSIVKLKQSFLRL